MKSSTIIRKVVDLRTMFRQLYLRRNISHVWTGRDICVHFDIYINNFALCSLPYFSTHSFYFGLSKVKNHNAMGD